MKRYYRHFKRMEQWTRLNMWVERGYLKPPKEWEIMKLFPYKHDLEDVPYYRKRMKIDYSDPINQLKRNFLKKYPEHINTFNDTNTTNYTLIDSFVNKQYALMKEGYNEYKAFEIIEKELSDNLQKEKRDRSIVEDMLISNRTRSLMDVFEQREEFVQRQKVMRMERDLPEFMRSETYKSFLDYDPHSVDMIVSSKKRQQNKIERLGISDEYEPATYISGNNKDNDDTEDKQKLNFLSRSESILNYYHSIGEINDGLDTLQDWKIQRTAKESSQRFKNHMRSLMIKLEKYNVKLDDEGNIDLEGVNDLKVLKFIKDKERLIRIVLMSKDLDFEVPHRQRQAQIKSEILDEINKEQKRLIDLYSGIKKEVKVESEENIISYEDLYGLEKKYGTEDIDSELKKLSNSNRTKKLLSYEEWLETLSPIDKSTDIFNKDLEYKNYFYIESLEDKEIHLKEQWIKSRKERLEASVSSSSQFKSDFTKINKEISELIRSIRRQVDKYLIKNNHPIFFGNNIRFYDKQELIYDAEMNFYQIKRFLNEKTSILKNDKSISKNYLELMETIRRKKIMEKTVAKFEKPKFYNENDLNQEKKEEEEDENERLGKNDSVLKMMDNDEYLERFEELMQSNDVDAKTQEKKLKEKLLEHFEKEVNKFHGKELYNEKKEDEKKEKEMTGKGKKKEKLKVNDKEKNKKDKELKKKGKK